MNDSDRLKVTPEQKLQHKIWMIAKLSSYFGVSRKILSEDINLNEPLVYSPILKETFNVGYEFYCTHLDPKQISLSILFNSKKLGKSPLFQMYLDGEAQSSGNMVMALHLSASSGKGDVYAMHRAEGYDGKGGFFVKIKENNDEELSGFVIEPLSYFLETNWPKPAPELD